MSLMRIRCACIPYSPSESGIANNTRTHRSSTNWSRLSALAGDSSLTGIRATHFRNGGSISWSYCNVITLNYGTVSRLGMPSFPLLAISGDSIAISLLFQGLSTEKNPREQRSRDYECRSGGGPRGVCGGDRCCTAERKYRGLRIECVPPRAVDRSMATESRFGFWKLTVNRGSTFFFLS
jgi:hypothetical protein